MTKDEIRALCHHHAARIQAGVDGAIPEFFAWWATLSGNWDTAEDAHWEATLAAHQEVQQHEPSY